MNKVVLSIGSNSDDCFIKMNNCIKWLSTEIIDIKTSHIYSTPAVNGKDRDYLNAVASGYSRCEFEDLKYRFKQYEQLSGRTLESKKKGVIPIDIDIVMWNDVVLKDNDYKQQYFQIGWTLIKDI